MMKQKYHSSYERSGSGFVALVTILTLIVIFIALTADTKQEPVMQYREETFGISLTLPLEWDGRYETVTTENEMIFRSKAVNAAMEGAGTLFTIVRQPGELITEADVQQGAVMERILFQENGYTYLLRLPSDVQYPVSDVALKTEYEALLKSANSVIESALPIGDQLPVASVSGFHVVGTSFFTAEIPENWILSVDATTPWKWLLTEDGTEVGNIEMIPYHSESETALKNSDYQNRYLVEEETLREFRISVSRGSENTVILNKMKANFKPIAGPYNVIDLQSTANAYVEKGGTKLFGQIKGFEFTQKEPTSLKLHMMEYITTEEAELEPNGFLLKDLWRTRTWKLAQGATIALLSNTDRNAYTFYGVDHIDSAFVAENDLDNRYFHLIAAKDGEVKIVLEQYIP